MNVRPGEIIGDAWRLYREHWQHFLPIALVVYLILGVVTLALVWALDAFGAALGGVLGIVGVFWLQGALTEAVADVRDGRADMSLGDTFRRAQPRLPSIIGAGLLAGLGIVVGLVLFIVPGLILLTWWSMIVPAIVLEGRPALKAFGRSRELVRGNGWNVFGVIVLTVLVLIAMAIVTSIALFWLPDGPQSFVQNVVQNTLAYPFMALALTLTYFALAGRGAPAAASDAPMSMPPMSSPPPPAAPASPGPPASPPPAD